MNKSSSLLLQLYLHLLHFLIMNKSSYFQKKSILCKSFKKKKKRKFSKKALGLGALGSYFLGCFQKKKKSIKIFNSLKKFKISKFFKKKSSLNSSSRKESYDPFSYSPVVQHQVNCPPLAFIKAWNMSQTRGICQVCQNLFNE